MGNPAKTKTEKEPLLDTIAKYSLVALIVSPVVLFFLVIFALLVS